MFFKFFTYHFRSIISDSVGHEADESSENEDDDDVLEAKTPVAQNYYGYNNSPEKSCYSNSIQSTPPSIRKVPPNTLKRNSFTREGNHGIYGLLSFSSHFGNLVFGCFCRRSHQNIT